jgi:hypothetical protein
MSDWRINEKKTQSHWLEAESSYDWGHEDPWLEYQVIVKWDGCTHFYQNNLPEGMDPGKYGTPEYLHICGLVRFIKDLEELRDLAVKHFGEEWLNQ